MHAIDRIMTTAASAVILGATTSAMAADTSTFSNSCNGQLWGVEDKGELARFDAELRHALESHNVAQLATLISYPLRVNGPGPGSIAIVDPPGLQSHIEGVFSARVVAAILQTSRRNVLCRDEGLSYGNGAIWVQPDVLGGTTTYRVFVVNLLGSAATRRKPREMSLRFVCETPKLRAVVDASDIEYRFRAWNRPRPVSDRPDVEIHEGLEAQGFSGTGLCAYETWTFRRRDVQYEVSGLGCTEGTEPKGSKGQLEISTAGGAKQSFWCR